MSRRSDSTRRRSDTAQRPAGEFVGRYFVEDHPYDRGYFDRVLDRPYRGNQEASEAATQQYRAGWKQAGEELEQEAHGP